MPLLDIVLKGPGVAAHASELARQAGRRHVRILAGLNLPAQVDHLITGLEILLVEHLYIMPAKLTFDDPLVANLMTKSKVLEFLYHLIGSEPGQFAAFNCAGLIVGQVKGDTIEALAAFLDQVADAVDLLLTGAVLHNRLVGLRIHRRYKDVSGFHTVRNLMFIDQLGNSILAGVEVGSK